MPGIKELKTRIKSISGTRKVTRAMQLVSAAKMRKAQDATFKSRPYSDLAWELIENLSKGASGVIPSAAEESLNDEDLPNSVDSSFDSLLGITEEKKQHKLDLLRSYPKASKIAVLLLTTNRGLVGSLNSNLINVLEKTITNEAKGLEADIITYGKKGREFVVRSKSEALADFEKIDRTLQIKDIYPISEFITQIYLSKKYQKVLIIYNQFISTLVQKPKVKQLLPFSESDVAQAPGLPKSSKQGEALSYSSHPSTDYLFEPDPKYVLNHLLPRIIESQIYQTILESEASEQSARMVMMKNATEAAGDLISDLTLTYNKLRQNKITTELAEITAGKIALE